MKDECGVGGLQVHDVHVAMKTVSMSALSVSVSYSTWQSIAGYC